MRSLDLLHGKTLLIFDFDGTIADTSEMHAIAFREVLSPLGISVNYADIAGLKTADAIRASARAAGKHLDDSTVENLVLLKQAAARSLIRASIQPLPGVASFLEKVRARYRIAMVSSGSRGTVELALAGLGYHEFFDPLICADDVVAAKPDPEGFLKALDLSGCSAADALVFEDSDAGVEAATAAGIDCWDVRQTPFTAVEARCCA